ncbi:hypothetical protein [Lactococcus lactis]|uniref:hypothetical protein n=1 Tax=Lactococcus lactis TaxID=1358 RepID=UPI002109C1BB|nr:hypothetical protein [Lactococcus lactis]MCQ4972373.1 hypothetical protein [Lactococcus lactis]MCQ4998179.1 hypothetical protein [Lactococcus lactis]
MIDTLIKIFSIVIISLFVSGSIGAAIAYKKQITDDGSTDILYGAAVAIIACALTEVFILSVIGLFI